MKKKGLFQGLAVILCMIFLVGYGMMNSDVGVTSDAVKEEQLEENQRREPVVVWDYSKDSASAGGIETYVNRFNEENDTYFVMYEYGYEEGIGLDAYRAKVAQALRIGEGADIINGDALESSFEWIQAQNFECLDDYMEAVGVNQDDYEVETFEGCIYEGRVYGVNIRLDENQYSTLFINKNASNKEGAWEFINYLLQRKLRN